LQPQPETYLIKALKQGSVEAFENIYNMYAARLYAFCYSYTKSRETSEDIVQDVFMKLWNKREEIRQEESLKALLFVMVKNGALNAMTAVVNSSKFEDYVRYCDTIPNGPQHDSLEYSEFLHEVKSAISTLPTTQRKVVELSKLSLFSNREIAEKLGLSEQTVKNSLSLGLKTVRKKIVHTLTIILLIVNCSI
jgi:RNA polymerase sigma-70 factor (ECF subfamily)